jgi:hypothetical protein
LISLGILSFSGRHNDNIPRLINKLLDRMAMMSAAVWAVATRWLTSFRRLDLTAFEKTRCAVIRLNLSAMRTHCPDCGSRASILKGNMRAC